MLKSWFSPMIVAVAAFFPWPAAAQCYTFFTGNDSITLRMTNLPVPATTTLNGISYLYTLSGLPGNTAVLNAAGTAYTLYAPSGFNILTTDTSDISTGSSKLNILLTSQSPSIEVLISLLGGPANLFQNGLVPVLPEISQWASSSLTAITPNGVVGPASITAISSGCGSATFNSEHRDFDGDGKADMGVWRPWTGIWYVLPSSNPSVPKIEQWGVSGDITTPDDYDGDGKTDFAVWRPSNGTWFVIPSANPAIPVMQQWGNPGDIPVPGDYDGDGKADFAVWRPSNGTWFVIPSVNPTAPIMQQWGNAGDVPVPGDYDGDGKSDFAVWRPSDGTWYVILSKSPAVLISQQWGFPGDVPIAADYDGDGKTDFAIWRPASGMWWIIPSSNPSTPLSRQWGVWGDLPQ